MRVEAASIFALEGERASENHVIDGCSLLPPGLARTGCPGQQLIRFTFSRKLYGNYAFTEGNFGGCELVKGTTLHRSKNPHFTWPVVDVTYGHCAPQDSR